MKQNYAKKKSKEYYQIKAWNGTTFFTLTNPLTSMTPQSPTIYHENLINFLLTWKAYEWLNRMTSNLSFIVFFFIYLFTILKCKKCSNVVLNILLY